MAKTAASEGLLAPDPPPASPLVPRLRHPTTGGTTAERVTSARMETTNVHRKTRSYAPLPSTLRIVAFGFESIAARSKCPTQSVPALVDSANWNGAHSASNTFMNCFANVLATRRRRVQPVAIPLTPPLGFVSAVSRGSMQSQSRLALCLVRADCTLPTTVPVCQSRPASTSNARTYNFPALQTIHEVRCCRKRVPKDHRSLGYMLAVQLSALHLGPSVLHAIPEKCLPFLEPQSAREALTCS